MTASKWTAGTLCPPCVSLQPLRPSTTLATDAPHDTFRRLAGSEKVPTATTWTTGTLFPRRAGLKSQRLINEEFPRPKLPDNSELLDHEESCPATQPSSDTALSATCCMSHATVNPRGQSYKVSTDQVIGCTSNVRKKKGQQSARDNLSQAKIDCNG